MLAVLRENNVLSFLILNPTLPGCAISIAFAFSWQMALLMLAVVPFVALGSMLDMFLITGHNKTQQNTQESAGIEMRPARDHLTV